MEFTIHGKGCYPPEVIAVWSKQTKKNFVEEKLVSIWSVRGQRYCIQRTVGEKALLCNFLPRREMCYRTYYREILRDEAEEWLKEHVSTEIREACLNDWPFSRS